MPTVFDADVKSLGEIARETRALAERVRDGVDHPARAGRRHVHGLQPRHVRCRSFTAIINPPQAAILSVGSLEPQRRGARRRDRRAAQMTVTLACDHRILYGADAARFLARIRELLEQPAALTL